MQQTVEITENVRLAKDTYRLRFRSPEMARRIVPGQFLMLRIAGLNDPLIGRPLALYDTIDGPSGEPESIDVVYLVKGKLTSRLWQMQPGQRIDVWGPLGNGFERSEVRGSEVGIRDRRRFAEASPRSHRAPHHGRRRHRLHADARAGSGSACTNGAMAIRRETCRGVARDVLLRRSDGRLPGRRRAV